MVTYSLITLFLPILVNAAMALSRCARSCAAEIWTLILAGYYNPNGLYFLFPMLSYAPGNHWRCELGLVVFGHVLLSLRNDSGKRPSAACVTILMPSYVGISYLGFKAEPSRRAVISTMGMIRS